MNRVIDIDLTGAEHPFRLHEDAYDALGRYLHGARERLAGDVAGTEVIDDLERSISQRLSALAGASNRVLTNADITSVLEEVGDVEVEGARPSAKAAAVSGRPARRRLYRIREGQNVAGVCMGLATYADLDVNWVRTIFLALTALSVGAFLLVYIVLAFVLPVAETREEWAAKMRADEAHGAA